MALIFNSITQFEIQPERTKKRVKRDELDTLSEVWTGPSALEDTFVPPIGAGHPDFSLMTVISTSVKRLPASVSEVTLQYQGKLDNSGGAQYTSVPTISQHWAEGEVAMGSGGTTISRRYSGRCVDVAYLTNRRPSGHPTNIGLAKEFLGFTNVWDQVTSFGPSPVTIMPPIEKLSCTDVKVDDKADGWYKITETYQSRMYPGESVTGISVSAPPKPKEPAGPITIKPLFPEVGSAEWYAQSDVRQAQSEQTTGAGVAVATAQGTTLGTSTAPGSVAADTTQQTGIDPGQSLQGATPAPEASPTLAASDAGYSWGDLATAAIASYSLDY
jgi:hypothetical protein